MVYSDHRFETWMLSISSKTRFHCFNFSWHWTKPLASEYTFVTLEDIEQSMNVCSKRECCSLREEILLICIFTSAALLFSMQLKYRSIAISCTTLWLLPLSTVLLCIILYSLLVSQTTLLYAFSHLVVWLYHVLLDLYSVLLCLYPEARVAVAVGRC